MHSKFIFFGGFVFLMNFSFFLSGEIFAQNYGKILESMNTKDKFWAVKNYSSIKKAKTISVEVIQTMDSLNKINFLGGNSEGGIFDAFRHIYWMYRLSSEIGEKKARKIGEIYERYGQWVFFHQQNSGYDSVGMVMDLFNNELGISLSDSNIVDSLVFNKIQNIIEIGQAKIIKKTQNGESLDIYGNIIPDSVWKKKWNNGRTLIFSNEKY